MRVEQPLGEKGSLKWIQRAVEKRPDLLQPLGVPDPINWLSPRREDNWAEYRDATFLSLLGLDTHIDELKTFWPRGGPQWDALGRTGDRVFLVEAKAHIGEFLSPATQASDASRARIAAAFAAVQEAESLVSPSDWTRCFYQLANRLAHLSFLRHRGVDAILLLVGFTGDEERNGPRTSEAWSAAEACAFHALGVPTGHPLRKAVLSVHPPVADLS